MDSDAAVPVSFSVSALFFKEILIASLNRVLTDFRAYSQLAEDFSSVVPFVL